MKHSGIKDDNLSDPQLATATKEVARSLGGDTEATESELLSTLRLHSPETTAEAPPSLRSIVPELCIANESEFLL